MGAYVWRGFVVFLFVFASYIFVFKIGEDHDEVKHKRQKRSPVDEMVQSEVDKMSHHIILFLCSFSIFDVILHGIFCCVHLFITTILRWGAGNLMSSFSTSS